MAPLSHACGAGLAELLSSQCSHYCWSSRAIRRSAFFVSRRSGLHQGPSKIGHSVARRTSRRAVTHTAGCSSLPAWVRLRVHVAVRRRRARYRLLRSAEPRTARPASHAAARLGCGPSRGQLRSFRVMRRLPRSFVVYRPGGGCEPGGSASRLARWWLLRRPTLCAAPRQRRVMSARTRPRARSRAVVCLSYTRRATLPPSFMVQC